MNKIEALVEGKAIPAKTIKLMDEERERMINYVEEKARDRKRSMGKLDDADFFCGAMSLMYALGMEPPAGWVFGIMCNRPEMYGMEKKSGKRTTKV